MKAKSFTLAVFVAFWGPAHANNLDKSCSTVATLAEKVMTLRQNGATLSEVLNVFDGDTPTDNGGREMAKEAYSSPRFSLQSNKTEASQEFRNRWHLKCLNLEPIR